MVIEKSGPLPRLPSPSLEPGDGSLARLHDLIQYFDGPALFKFQARHRARISKLLQSAEPALREIKTLARTNESQGYVGEEWRAWLDKLDRQVGEAGEGGDPSYKQFAKVWVEYTDHLRGELYGMVFSVGAVGM